MPLLRQLSHILSQIRAAVNRYCAGCTGIRNCAAQAYKKQGRSRGLLFGRLAAKGSFRFYGYEHEQRCCHSRGALRRRGSAVKKRGENDMRKIPKIGKDTVPNGGRAAVGMRFRFGFSKPLQCPNEDRSAPGESPLAVRKNADRRVCGMLSDLCEISLDCSEANKNRAGVRAGSKCVRMQLYFCFHSRINVV